LFGEKYVDLVEPARAASPPGTLHDGSVITQDRSRTAIETGKVFDDILPLLRTLQPVKINATLNALATALEERGNALGTNVVLTDRYLGGIDPELPRINADISGLADLADSYNVAAPDLLRLLRNSAASLNTVVVPHENALVHFFAGTKGFANTTNAFLKSNENNFISLAANSKPVLGVLATYSPEVPCLLRGLTDIQSRLEGTFATGPYLYVHLEIINRSGAAYTPVADNPQDTHLYERLPAAPSCAGLPQPGVKFTYPHPGVKESTVRANEAALRTPGYGDIGPVGSAGEIGVVDSLAGPLMGRPVNDVPDFTTLLLGPLLRGAAVSLR
jgi:ABC-type transporter Mla subunit MlaD